MKRAISLALAVILLLSLLLTIVPAVSAAGYGCRKNSLCDSPSETCGFVDENDDGLCDNRSLHCGENFADADKDGVCDNHAEHCGKNFVDENKDGVCDSHGETCGRSFTDANRDGICDDRTQNTCPRRQMRANHHGKGRHHN